MVKIPFDVSYRIEENLRDVPNDPTHMRHALSWLRSQLEEETDSHRRIKLLGLISSYARMLKELPTAEQYALKAIAQAQTIQDSRLEIANQIRLAHIRHWQENYVESEALFEDTLARCRSDAKLSEYLDFAYQHAGKCQYDQQQYDAALAYFREALSLRIEKADSSLIDSTQYAISRTLEARQLGKPQA